jgi:hypothetical protein
MMNHYLKII